MNLSSRETKSIKMKHYWKITCLWCSLALGSSIPLTAQELEIPRSSPMASVSQVIGVCRVMVNYGRPSVRERQVFGGLVKYNKVWRAGADEATTLSFNYEIKLGEKNVPAGKYGLFMIPQEDSWTVILNSDWNQWGAYNYDSKNDVVRIKVTPQAIDHTEMCTYSFTEVTKTTAVLNMQWENTQISIPIETNTHEQTLREIEKAVNASIQNWYLYSAAAQYHFYERKESEKALDYINIAIALNAPNPAPWMLKSQILASQGKYQEAITEAESAIVVSKKHQFWYEVEENEESIKKWETLR